MAEKPDSYAVKSVLSRMRSGSCQYVLAKDRTPASRKLIALVTVM